MKKCSALEFSEHGIVFVDLFKGTTFLEAENI